MSNIDIGTSMRSLNVGEKIHSYTGVIIHVGQNSSGDEVTFSAGNNSGYVLEVDNPIGTQGMAYAILAGLKLRGISYQPFDAESAILDPSAEIGDNITVNGVGSVIMSTATKHSRLMAADVSAPMDEELNHEFKYEPKSVREFRRESSYTRSRLTIAQDEIRAEVVRATGSETTLRAALSVQADRITSEVNRATAAEGNLGTRIDQRLDSITLSVSSTGGTSTFTLKDGSATLDTQTLDLSVKSVNISGTLTIGQLDSTVQGKINGAVKRSSMIYYSKAASGAPSAPSSWVSTTAASQETWTQTRPEYSQSYAYLYIARQTETEDGTYTCTTPTRDYTTTVIDGANIITGSITANKLSVTDLSALNATIGGWTINATNIEKNVAGSYYVRLSAPSSPSSSIAAIGVRDLANDRWMFYVTYGGAVYARNATIEGKITATSGVIGGLSINSSGILKGISDQNIAKYGISGGGGDNAIMPDTISSGDATSGVRGSLGWGDAYGAATQYQTSAPEYFYAQNLYATRLYANTYLYAASFQYGSTVLSLQTKTIGGVTIHYLGY